VLDLFLFPTRVEHSMAYMTQRLVLRFFLFMGVWGMNDQAQQTQVFTRCLDLVDGWVERGWVRWKEQLILYERIG